MGNILNVLTTESIRTINPSEGLNKISTLIPTPYSSEGQVRLYATIVSAPGDVHRYYRPSASIYNGTGTLWYYEATQSVSDYYYALNGNNKVNSEISLHMYPNPTAGSDPSIPTTTKILTTDFGVPTISNFAGTSSYTGGG